MPRHFLRTLPALLLLALGCSDSSVSPERDLVGSWVLVSVNDAPLPYLDEVRGQCRHYTDALTMTLRADGTGSFQDTRRTECDDGGSQTRASSEEFRWSAEETLLSFRFEEEVRVSFPMTLAGDRLTVVTAGESMTFERE